MIHAFTKEQNLLESNSAKLDVFHFALCILSLLLLLLYYFLWMSCYFMYYPDLSSERGLSQ